jgi:phospholipase C
MPVWAAPGPQPQSGKAPVTGINQINHILFLAQENRSFDHYFGYMRAYWKANGYPDQSFDGLPQFNPKSGIPPLFGPPPMLPTCDPATKHNCVIDSGSPTRTSFHLLTQCIENPSPSWNESHNDWDYADPLGNQAAKNNGFVWTAAYDARALNYYDKDGRRAMGYYTDADLNYYYFMATNFATSDRWFMPVMTRTAANRYYLDAGTSKGIVYPEGTDGKDSMPIDAMTIFQELQSHGLSWKIYVNPTNSPCTGPPYDAACLVTLSYLQYLVFGQQIPTMYPNNIGTIGVSGSDYDNDVANGTLPNVGLIESAGDAGLDEHPSVSDSVPEKMQPGAAYVAGLINELMFSPSWSDSVFILTYDEGGGLYDHVSPQPAVSPDGIKPKDLLRGDLCTTSSGPTCDFVYTGYRIPLIVVSPFTKVNYVSHTVADSTAILKLIETRFNLPALTARDAAQPDMTEFFDFGNPPWMTPPSPPAQNLGNPCYLNKLP